MKTKRFIGVLVLFSFFLLNITMFLSSKSVSAEPTGLTPGDGTEKARLAYCQIMGDRTGCKNDPNRTCSSEIFCK
ncbi:MAG: hypothetical protein R6U15_03085 [Candidatus Izemoplasmatales bacterium]